MKEIVDRDSRSEVYLDFVIYAITKRFAVRGLNTTKLYTGFSQFSTTKARRKIDPRFATRGRPESSFFVLLVGNAPVPFDDAQRRWVYARGRSRRVRPDWLIPGCSRSFEGCGLKRYSREWPAHHIRSNEWTTSFILRIARIATGWGERRAIGRRRSHKMKARDQFEIANNRPVSNPERGVAAKPQVGEARCGGVGIDRPQYPRRRDRGYSVCLRVLGGFGKLPK